VGHWHRPGAWVAVELAFNGASAVINAQGMEIPFTSECMSEGLGAIRSVATKTWKERIVVPNTMARREQGGNNGELLL
jgi:hypothetical protein